MNSLSNKYIYYDIDGNKYNCRNGKTGKFIDLEPIDFLSYRDVSVNTVTKTKDQNYYHSYKNTTDTINKKTYFISVISYLWKLIK